MKSVSEKNWRIPVSRICKLVVFILLIPIASCSRVDLPDASEPPFLSITESATRPGITPPIPGIQTSTAADEQQTADILPGALPEGLKILYIKDRDIWLWAPDSHVQLTNSSDVYDLRLSHDGELVAFIRRVDDFHAEIWLKATAGGDVRRLVGVEAFDAIAEGTRDPNAVAVNPYQYEWIPAMHRLAFSSYQIYDGPGLTPLDDLQIADADAFERWTLLQPGQGGEFTYSPDGNQVAIVTPTEINLMDANAGNWRLLLNYEQVLTYSEYRYYAKPYWSPDSTFLRVALPPTDPLDAALPTEIWYLPAKTGGAFQESQIIPVPFFDTPVFFSPDLHQLMYLAEAGNPEENRRDLIISLADGSAERVFDNEYLIRLFDWGLDSTHFTYVTGSDRHTWLGSTDQNARPFNIEPQGGISVHWIDERLFVYTREGHAGFEIYLDALDGGSYLIDIVVGPPPVIDSAQ